MFTVFWEHKLLCAAFVILLLLSIICQIMIGVIYHNMIKETENMSATGNQLLRQCKLKFANCYQLGGGVSNIPVFVDKFLAKISFMRISLTGMQHLSAQLMLLAVVAAGIGSCLEIAEGETVGRILPYYIASFVGLYLYFAISGLVDTQGKREQLKINLVDYLENHMVSKLRQSAIDWEELTGEGKAEKKIQSREKDAGKDAGIEKIKEEAGESAETGQRGSERDEPFSFQEEAELEELLREFLV